MALIDLPLVHPERKTVGFRPLKTWGHFRKLVADKEDTAQVFHIIEATKSRKSHQQGWDFMGSEQGQRLLREDVDIPTILDDHDRWADCGPNSVAQHYIRFMKREGLSAAGLVAESHRWMPPEKRLPDLTEWYFERLRDTHDLFHVLTSYGRDALGEQALLGFSYEQNHNPGVLFIAYAGAREIKKAIGTKAPLYAAVKEGRELGRAADKLAHMDVEAVMREDIDEARARLNIGEPVIYRECLAILEAEGHGCCDLLAPQAA
ncbi:Coq4 family protein [Erythrobacter sp. W53]|uniref:Coq4 family protein n=1 Tax=Erythrobacter sp. W53 TaxID=3425947 RepID=UPI003D7673E4